MTKGLVYLFEMNSVNNNGISFKNVFIESYCDMKIISRYSNFFKKKFVGVDYGVQRGMTVVL